MIAAELGQGLRNLLFCQLLSRLKVAFQQHVHNTCLTDSIQGQTLRGHVPIRPVPPAHPRPQHRLGPVLGRLHALLQRSLE